ncbi:MAG: TIGR00730 family Rossman fold protein [Candidatus Komeilibacteria bacterium]|nr:TIGR00730 family Rossman fold protein [Candidatus Komeilibacteria bacterium]
MRRICVFLSGNVTDAKYAEPAKAFARLMVKNGYGLVWGGTNLGLMKIVCTTVQEEGGHLSGVTMELLKDSRKLDADEMTIAPDLSERKKLLLEKSDAIVVMVGGIGTLDEVTEVLELKKHGAHNKPIVFLNTDDFFGGLRQQLERMESEGFLPKKIADLACFADTPEEAIEYIERNL